MGKNLRKLVLAISTMVALNFSSAYVAKAENMYLAYEQNHIATTLEELKVPLAEGISNGQTKIEIKASKEAVDELGKVEFGTFMDDVLYKVDDYYHNEINNYRYEGNWVDGSYTLEFTINYLETPDQTMQVQQEVKRILTNIVDDTMTEDEKVKVIHDYIVTHVQYDVNGLNNRNEAHTAYAALFEDKTGEKNQTVCQGYALVFYKMAKEAGLEARIMTGKSRDQNHAWNLIRINGEWYQIDLTWDDPTGVDDLNYVRYDYYNLTDEQLKKDHQVFNDLEQFSRCTTDYGSTISDVILLKSIDRHYELPQFTAKDDNEFKQRIEESIKHKDSSCKFRLIAPGADKSRLLEQKEHIINEIFNTHSSEIDGSYSYQPVKEYAFTNDKDFIFEYKFIYLKNVNSININKNSIELSVGEEEQISVQAAMSDGSNEDTTDKVRYLSNNPNIVTVDNNTGIIYANQQGKAKILVEYGGHSQEVNITVNSNVVVKSNNTSLKDLKITGTTITGFQKTKQNTK